MDSRSSEIETAVEATSSGCNNENASLADSSNQHIARAHADTSNQTECITCMNPKLYKYAERGAIVVVPDEEMGETNDHRAETRGDVNAYTVNKTDLPFLLTPTKNTVLHIYITAQCEKEESTDFVSGILRDCPQLLWQANAKGDTLLHIAARYGRVQTVELLWRAFHENELEEGYFGPAQQMLSRKTNKDKDTALHDAVRFNNAGVVQILTTEDPGFSYRANAAGETPLYLAAERRFGDLVSQILRKCISPTYGGPNETTALHAAVINNDEGMTKKILQMNGALTKEADGQGWTPLHYAARFGYLPIVKMLLEKDESSNDISAAYRADRVGRTALHIAAALGHHRIMKKIISSYPDCCELVDKRGWNVLHFAIDGHNFRAIKVVTANPSLTHLLNEKNIEGNTPLHQLAVSGCFNITLLQHQRVDKMAFNKKNLNALDIGFAVERWFGGLGFIREVRFIENLELAGVRKGQRNITYQDGSVEESMKGIMANDDSDQGRQQTDLIVATLIATVTFAAGFTMPGGYITDKGPDQGTAILRRKVAFKAFVISDAIAMLLSSYSVTIHLLAPAIRSKARFRYLLGMAFPVNMYAVGAMVVAFVTGLYAVLENSSGLANAICVIAGIIVIYFFYLLYICKGGNCALIRLLTIKYAQKHAPVGTKYLRAMDAIYQPILQPSSLL
ncbi:hypothetical protein L1049_010941 [Liquidambar formosana]|uniref:PGG domain-containing protein n=1 Tax=Liquidambar formosana TaxID=63359 RepID=A0AAP0RVY5_LIQFO